MFWLLGKNLWIGFATLFSMPSFSTETLFPWSRGGHDVMALPMNSTILIFDTLISKLTEIAVEIPITTTSTTVGFSMTGANVDEGFIFRQNVHVGTRPELIFFAPFRSLSHKSNAAVDAC